MNLASLHSLASPHPDLFRRSSTSHRRSSVLGDDPQNASAIDAPAATKSPWTHRTSPRPLDSEHEIQPPHAASIPDFASSQRPNVLRDPSKNSFVTGHLDAMPVLPRNSSRSQTSGSEGPSIGHGNEGDDPDDANGPPTSHSRLQRIGGALRRQLAFFGPGIVAAICFIDPGNWQTDLDAGSQLGYTLLFVILLSALFGVLLQILATRMGIVTGKDLAQSTREWLLPEELLPRPIEVVSADSLGVNADTPGRRAEASRPRFRWYRSRVVALWTLYVVAEVAMAATELAELIGSAIALNLLFPALPLWGGVLITGLDVLLILFLYRPQGSLRAFEVFLRSLVVIVLACFIVLVVKVKPHWPDVFRGYVPSKELVQGEAPFLGIGILGAVIMPHSLFLGSHFSTANRMPECVADDESVTHADCCAQQTRTAECNGTTSATGAARVANPSQAADLVDAGLSDVPDRGGVPGLLARTRAYVGRRFPGKGVACAGSAPRSRLLSALGLERQARRTKVGGGVEIPNIDAAAPCTDGAKPRLPLKIMRQHLTHASLDLAFSLLGFAMTINSAILIVAGAAFYYGAGNAPGSAQIGDLYQAFDLLSSMLGKVYAILFAIALLSSGQAASITCTLAGQIVSEGMIKWRLSPFMRRLLTRLLTMIPGLIVSVVMGKRGLSDMLLASQVALSMALPFVLVPLLVITGSKAKMSVTELQEPANRLGPSPSSRPSSNTPSIEAETPSRVERDEELRLSKTRSGEETPTPSRARFDVAGPRADVPSQATSHITARADDGPVVNTAPEIQMASAPAPASRTAQQEADGGPAPDAQSPPTRVTVDFANRWWLRGLSWLIWLAITAADVYVLATSFK